MLHPPPGGELDASVDPDRRAVYFEQAAYGVPVRMALISLPLGLHPSRCTNSRAASRKNTVYDQPPGACTNANCIVHDPMEAHVRNSSTL